LNKKIKKNLYVLLISFLTLIFIYNQNLFRKIYNLSINDYQNRLSQASGFCSKDSAGYLVYLKKKFNFNFNPAIYNYEDSVPDSNWPIYDNRLKNNLNHKILLNYKEQPELVFYPYENYFYTKNTFKYGEALSEIFFDLKVPAININSNLVLYTREYGTNKKEIIYDKPFNELVNNQKKIKFSINKIKVNSVIYKKIFLDIKESEVNKINSIKIIIKNQFDLNNFKILDSYNNQCYYIK
tara:strand:+ start:159 stop:875 length:717 start_codon:yes stop_codon:yes gene_type:complete